jgi:MFS family permease
VVCPLRPRAYTGEPDFRVAVAELHAACSYTTLIVNRFFLGLFEAAVLPLFGVITMTWYRRREREQ